MIAQLWTNHFQDLSDTTLYGVFPLLIFASIYFVIGFASLPFDFWNSLNNKIRHTRCQPDKTPTYDDVIKILKVTVPQICTLYPLASYLSVPFLKTRLSRDVEDLPTTTEFFVSIVVFLLATEAFFYYNHRMLHTKYFYSWCHKKHHEFTSPFALECVYFHPFESVTNFGVVGLGPILMKSHVSMLYLWTLVATLGILLHHCGYEAPGDSTPWVGSMSHFHDYHHQYFNKAFGVFGLLDWVHGTGYDSYNVYHDKWEEKMEVKKVE